MKYWSLALLMVFVGCQAEHAAAPTETPAVLAGVDEAKVDQYLAQYTPYEMSYDASSFTDREKDLLKKMIEASRVIDELNQLQHSRVAIEYRAQLEAIEGNPLATKLLTLLKRNAGPFEGLNDNVAFMGDKEFYPGLELYPHGMTAEQFDEFYVTLDEQSQRVFMDPYTVIKDDGEGGYIAEAYHSAYAEPVGRLVALLRECAELADNPSFKNYLELKADALTTDKYFDADVAWVEFDRDKFDFCIGPFETYADGIKGVKASYESLVEIVDQKASKDLDIYTQYLGQMEANLPVPAVYKSKVEGLTAKFVVVRDIYRGGEAATGYQAIAANLPNDPEVHAKAGTVKTFWKNMFEARFNAIITPVSNVLIEEEQLPNLSDEGFFQFVLMHEICHALGPRTVKVGPNKGMATNAAIGPNYNALEEAKADIVGLHSLAFLMDQGVLDAERENEFYVSYLGSLFRTIRFGLGQAHGRAAAISLNYLLDQGALRYDKESGRWGIVFDKMRDGVGSLSTELLILLGDGDPEKVAAFMDEWGVVTPPIQAAMDATRDLPIDVLPQYSVKWD